MYKIVFVVLVTLLTGCAGQQYQSTGLANSLQSQSPEVILEKAKKNVPESRDYVQYYLNLGYLQLLSNDFQGSIDSFTLAKKEMAVLEATSVTENIGAGTVSEVLRSYSGYPTDRVMVHNMLALSYLFNDDIYAARVEMLQADVSMKKLYNGKDQYAQLASTHLISAIVYEILDEESNALISYRNAAETIEQEGLPLPLGVKQALLRMSYNLGATQQYDEYKKKFSYLPQPTKNTKKQVFTLYFDGVVSNKIQKTVVVPNHDREQLIRISMPAYPQKGSAVGRAKVAFSDQKISTEVVESVDKLVRDDLGKEYPSILLLTTTRALAKYELVKKGHEQDALIGVLLNIATVITEVADLRSWNVLPSNIQFAYSETSDDMIMLDSSKLVANKIDISGASKHLILMSSTSNKVFHYQQ
ncbi:MAG: hypothetical protein V7782_08910 [Psychromonas sp.]